MRVWGSGSSGRGGCKSDVLRSVVLSACCIKAIALFAILLTIAGSTAAAKDAGPFSQKVRADGPPVEGAWGWFVTPASQYVVKCWVFADLVCQSTPLFRELHVLPRTSGAHPSDWYRNRPKTTDTKLLAPQLKVGTWIKHDTGYACYLGSEVLTCKNNLGYGIHFSTIDGQTRYFHPASGSPSNKDMAFFDEGTRVFGPVNAFEAGEGDGKTPYGYSCRLIANDTLRCNRHSPWLSVLLHRERPPVLQQEAVVDSPVEMAGPLMGLLQWWRHGDHFACILLGEDFENRDLICENSKRHGFRLSRTQVELF